MPNENTTAIQINVNNVTIDLNGFAILGPNVCATDGVSVAQPCTRPGTGMGIDGGTAVPFNLENTRVMNGTIDGMGNIGIFANVNARVEKMNVSSCGSFRIDTFGGVILVIDNNNGGIANPQISGGTHTGDNTCGSAPCP